MTNVRLTENQWEMLWDFLRRDPHTYVGNEAGCHRFVEAVLWISCSGAQWRLLPPEYGNWNSIYFWRGSDENPSGGLSILDQER